MKRLTSLILVMILFLKCTSTSNYKNLYYKVKDLDVCIFNGWRVEQREIDLYSFTYSTINSGADLNNGKIIFFTLKDNKVLLPHKYRLKESLFYDDLSTLMEIERATIKEHVLNLTDAFYKSEANRIISGFLEDSVISLVYDNFILTYYQKELFNQNINEDIMLDSNWYCTTLK